jgi:hypothetical protein
MSIEVATIALKMYQGGTFREGFVYKNRLKKPYDLTGYRARMQVRDAAGALIADLTTENGGITLGGVAGTIDLYVSDEDTAVMSFTTAQYDLFLLAPNGDAIPIIAGKVTLTKGQTKNA